MAVEILCVGYAAFDLCLPVDSFPLENSKCEITRLMESGGGPAANAAYLLAKWGVGSAFAGLIGQDDYGRRLREELCGAGVDVSLVEARASHPTPLSVVLINRQNGSRTIVNRKATGPPLQLREAGLRQLSPRVLLFDGHELDASLAALRTFPEAISILDAGSWREGTDQLAGRVNYLAASERFAAQASGLTGLNHPDDQRAWVRHLRERYQARVIVTLGENGLVGDDGSGFFHLAAFAAGTVDTTAAGDIFHGAFAYGIARALPLGETLRLASMAASLSVRQWGGRASIPSLEQTREALAHA